jgi:hypothetical protein
VEANQASEPESAPEQALEPAPESVPDWPEPTEEMRADYLKEMAAAYGVEVPPRTNKKDLVKLIKAARAESDGEPELTVE